MSVHEYARRLKMESGTPSPAACILEAAAILGDTAVALNTLARAVDEEGYEACKAEEWHAINGWRRDAEIERGIAELLARPTIRTSGPEFLEEHAQVLVDLAIQYRDLAALWRAEREGRAVA